MTDREAGRVSGNRSWPWLLVIAATFTLLNAVKPVTVDDPAYLRQAAWWAAHPADPFGGPALFYQTPVPAAQVASPPVGIGWLALGIRLLGPTPWALKLWLAPFVVLLVASLHSLMSRAAPGRSSMSLLAMMALSPSLLPSLNLMLDVPALALGVAALAAFGRGLEVGGIAIAGAGALLALALQTKYTSAPLVIAILAWGVFARRSREGLIAAGLGAAGFVLIELSLRVLAGSSPLFHYLSGRGARDPGGHHPLVTAWNLVMIAGVAAPLIPLALTSLGASRRWVTGSLIAVLAGPVGLALAPHALLTLLEGPTHGRGLNLKNVTIGWMGPACVGLAAVTAWRAGRSVDGRHTSQEALDRALVVWLVVECLLAPFVSATASVRRLLGAIVALSLLLARRTDPLGLEAGRRSDRTWVAVVGVVLGVATWVVDLDSATVDRRSLAEVLRRTRTHGETRPPAVVADHWGGFQYEAPRAGLRPVDLGSAPLERGEWLVVPFGVELQGVELDPATVSRVDSIPFVQRLPLTTRRAFYGGRVPIRRVDPTWIGATLYRVERRGTVLRRRALAPETTRP